MQQEVDPWTPELEAMLRTLSDEGELVYRLALQGEYPRLKGRHDWDQRTGDLMGRILTSQRAWNRVLAAVARKERELFPPP